MNRYQMYEAGSACSRPRIRRVGAAAVAIALIALAAVDAGARAASQIAESSVGRNYSRTSGPRVDPVLVPARVAKVAVVPGSPVGEAWAYGHTTARKDGFAQTDPQGQGVFLRYTRDTGWRIHQPMLNQEGRPDNPGVASFALAPNGEGWGVGGTGLIFHRAPGGLWKKDDAASAVATGDLFGISLQQDARGVYGYAVGPGPTFLRLNDGRWTVDSAGGVRTGSSELLGNLVSVATLDRDNAWAVAESARELVLWRRSSGGWTRQLTGKTLFDTAPSANEGTGGTPIINQYASGNAVSAADGVVWVSGVLQPVDGQRYVNQRGPGSDPSRPFVLRIGRDGSFRSYCAPIYQVSGSGVSSTSRLCDEAFPLASGTMPGLSAVPGGDVFAGGYGLFHFTRGRWVREPNVAGIVSSVAFSSAIEGWVSSYGNRSGSGLAGSTSNTLGHWTTGAAEQQILRRWPHPSREVVEAVAPAPSGGSAIAVGGAGSIIHLTPGVGWDVVASPTTVTLHDVAWPASSQAFAVGEGGTILRYDGMRWSADPASRTLTKDALYSVAFSSPSLGYAVGNKGTVLRFDGSGWRKESVPGDKRLNAVDFAGSDVVAVGERSTILVKSGSTWRIDRDAPERFKTGQEGLAPHLLSVTGLPDGRAFAGGALSLLIERAPGRRFERSTLPILSGSIHTLKAVSVAGRLRMLASIGGATTKYSGPGIIEPTGQLFLGDERGWRPVGEQRVAATGNEIDAPVRRDAVYDIAVDETGKGFAAGGFPADLVDDDGHLGTDPSGSIWRLSLDGTPEPAPNTATIPARAPAGTISFAFLGDSACTDGLCSAAMGSGVRADEVLARALADIGAAANDGTVRFAAFGGDMRRFGVPDELSPMKGLFDALSVPVYAAIGDRDLYGPDGMLASNGYYLRTFADRPAPWGTGKTAPEIAPASFAGNGVPSDSLARTHYAFDYKTAGRAALRMIFLDTSRSPFVPTAQNPPGDQIGWLQSALSSARALSIPSIVVMHQPLISPASNTAEAAGITAALTSGGAVAVLTSHERLNRSFVAPAASAPGAFTVYATGSAGSSLAGDWRPERGAYHAWQMVSVSTGDGPARVTVRSMPILESVALSAPDGREADAGAAVRFAGLGRLPDVGGGHLNGAGGDPTQVRAQYLRFPVLPRCTGLLAQDGCMPADVVAPHYRFFCENDLVCAFVREDPSRPGTPFRDGQGRLVRNEQSGLLCAFEPGNTRVVMHAGTRSMSVPFAVGGGSGPCNPRAFADPPVDVPDSEPAAKAQAQVLGVKEKALTPILKPKTFEIAAIPALAPPPVQPAPAPPGGGAARKEEREAATEKSEMTALPVGARTPSPWTGGIVGLLAALTFAGAAHRMRPRGARAPSTVQSNRYAYGYTHQRNRR